MNNLVVIENIKIRQDSQGRYCLNDLHKSAIANGANARTKEPTKFLSSSQIIELIAELTDTQNLGIGPISTIKGGLEQGTYVCKELVYAYAMWISPKFHLLVIRTFDDVRATHHSSLPNFTNPAEAARAWAEQFEQNQTLQIENKQQSTQIESMESYFRNGISPFEFVKGLNGVNSLKVSEFLIEKNWLYEDNRQQKRVKAYARDLYLTEENIEIARHGQEPFLSYKPVLLKKGASKLYEWYSQGRLPMKKNWDGKFTQEKELYNA